MAVAMAEQAVGLANGLLSGTEISERQQHLRGSVGEAGIGPSEAKGAGRGPGARGVEVAGAAGVGAAEPGTA